MREWLRIWLLPAVALAILPNKFQLNDENFLFDRSEPEYETVLTPADYDLGAQMTAALQFENGEIWDSDAMYSKERFEGDIANEKRNDGSGDGKWYNAIKNRHQLWPGGRIPYTISSQYSSYSRSLIASSMADYAQQTCVKWVPKEANDVNYVYIYPDRGCYSMVGKMGGKQSLSLGSGCIQKGIIIHELMHAVGFFHEQSRTDRDDYITIMWNNIQPGMQGQFEKYGQGTIQSLGTSYDYGSIMHYGTKAFSRNGQPTMVPKQKGATIGQRGGFSKVDQYKINKLYGCPVEGEKPSTAAPVTTTTQAPTTTATIRIIYPSPPTLPPAPVPGECKNTRGDCDDLAKQGWCIRNPGWMKTHCPVSCGMCIPSTTAAPITVPVTTTTPAPTTARPTAPPAPTLPPPPPSPGPTSDCEDLRVDCLVLVSQRYCKTSQNFMKSYCAKSCGFCYKPPPTEIPDTGRPPMPTLVTQPPIVTFAPPVTRGRPAPPPVPTLPPAPPAPPVPTLPPSTEAPGCTDKKHFCTHWKNAGFCEGIFMNYMKKNCPAACGMC
ncbi:unnamed protein product [Caenorhabditis auriculariae]|uniref:Metalloendopeptidase n=1 Tax=Caenorhabditis auriculariae TaxID=2777116 RepID=A0A8S1H0M7_9PELO|nr:unnamed protein product [Caenorhabditis auriculariae]